MNRLLLIIIVFGLIIGVSTAQDYSSAYIYTKKKDTIFCQLKVQDSYTNTGSFTYFLEGDKKSKKIFKEDIDSIHLGTKVFVFMSIHYKYSAGYEIKVYQKIEEGKLSLYAKTHEQTKALSPGSGNLSGAGNSYYEYFIKQEGISAIKKIGRVGFKHAILKYIDRNNSLVQKIHNKEYRYNDLPEIIREYNAWYTKLN